MTCSITFSLSARGSLMMSWIRYCILFFILIINYRLFFRFFLSFRFPFCHSEERGISLPFCHSVSPFVIPRNEESLLASSCSLLLFSSFVVPPQDDSVGHIPFSLLSFRFPFCHSVSLLSFRFPFVIPRNEESL